MKSLLRIAALLMLVACSREGRTPAPNVEPAPPTAAVEAAPSARGAVTLVSADGARTITITTDGPRVEVSITGGARYIGDASGGKRRYRDAATGGAFVEVKAGDDGGFKVRTPDSRLLWKIKVDADKIKVSDNEENQRPWVLKTKYEDKAKVLDPAGQEIGEVKYYRDSGKLKVKDGAGREIHFSNSGRMSPAFGVTLMGGVPEGHRLIVMAELIARGI